VKQPTAIAGGLVVSALGSLLLVGVGVGGGGAGTTAGDDRHRRRRRTPRLPAG
jgi:hypothetical protein